MNNICKTLAAGLLLAVAAPSAWAIQVGYCTDNIGRDNIFRLGSSEKQGMAIRLDSDKLAELRGRSITDISVAVGSRQTTDKSLTLFVASKPSGEALVSQTVTLSNPLKWAKYTLDTPYVITGDEGELYVGYTGSISTSASLLLSDGTADSEGCSYAWLDGRWVDIFGMNRGNALIRLGLDGDDITDVMIKPVAADGYFRAGQEYELPAQLFNFGSTTVNNLDVSVTVGNAEPVTLHFPDVEIAPATCFDFRLPAFAAATEGHLPVAIEVSGVEGESALADNHFDKPVYFYPAGMERSFLLEGFTGAACTNCPAGHNTINAFLESGLTTPVIEVMHHSGYQPDAMTMDCDLDYTFFYGGNRTYAPAVMLNRTVFPAIGNVPVMNTVLSDLTTAYEALETTEPYVSLALETAFDSDTRELQVKATVETHVDLPDAVNALNILLIQDGIISLQLPLGSYTHNAVCRGTLTGNSWGVSLPESACVAGGRYEYTTTYTLPEVIVSDYVGSGALPSDQRTIPTDPKNMKLVAYVAPFTQGDIAGHAIRNAVETRLGESYIQGGIASVQSVAADMTSVVAFRLEGNSIVAADGCTDLRVYTPAGARVNPSSLTPGLYIVSARTAKGIVTSKVLVK